VIFALSAQSNPLPFLPRRIFEFDKVLHAIEYAGLVALVTVGLDRVTGAGLRGAAALAVVVGACYGLTDELHQALVPGRSADVHDWLADAAGAGVGAILAVVALRWWRSRATLRA
jgi:VanZ family protein